MKSASGASMHLTKKSIENLEITGKRYSVFDDDLKGFGVRVGIKGDKSFYLLYRVGKGRSAIKRWLRLGSFPTMTVEQARQLAKLKSTHVALGEDPAEEVQAEKTALNVNTAFDLFFEQHGSKLKPNTIRTYRQIARDHIIPAMGKFKLDSIQYKHMALFA